LGRIFVALIATVAVVAAFPDGALGVSSSPLREFCQNGSEAGQCSAPGGLGIDLQSGDIYVADEQNKRIEKFTSWGDFLRAWGRDVVAQGPGNNGTGFEVCVPPEDACKAGLEGGASGEFGAVGVEGLFLSASPQGIAVDSDGDVYVVDLTNLRVQKFDSEGNFLLMFGGKVNKTKVEAAAPEGEQNLCPVDPGDVCQAGSEGTGNGQFGLLKIGGSIAVSPDGETIYVGDVGRIQEFDTEGHFTGEIGLAGEAVQSLAVDPAGDLYLTHSSASDITSATKPDVFKISPTGLAICMIKAHDPRAIGTGPLGEVYLVDGGSPREIVIANSNCERKELLFPPELSSTASENQFTVAPTVAVSSACGIEGVDLVFANRDSSNSFVRIYGTPPQDFDPPCRPPLEVPPTIEDQFASSVGTDGAVVRAKINPHFWPDTTYQVQYGTEECIEAGWEAACVKKQPVAPVLLSEKVIDAVITTKGIFLGATEALTPDTTYSYRFVAESSGGGPVFAEESSFHTFPLPSQPDVACPNQAFRTGPSASLPDCRAYELVSPLDKNNGDLASPRFEVIDQASSDGEAITFASLNAFADPASAPFFSQFMAERGAGGWATRSISAPRSSVSLILGSALWSPFKYFSEDLCEGWLLQDTDVPLAEGAPPGFASPYRRHGLRGGCGAPGYELLSSVLPPGHEPELEKGKYVPLIQGFSADGSIAVLSANAPLTEDASSALANEDDGQQFGIYQLYLAKEGELHLLSVLPGGEAADTHSALGTHQKTGPTQFYFREDSVHHAVSDDGSRVFWTETGDKSSYQENAAGGYGPGKLYLRLNPAQPQSAFAHGSATGTGKLTAGSNQVGALKTTGGTFEVGQTISASGIPAGTTITAVAPTSLTLSANATKTQTNVPLTATSACTEPEAACTLPVSAEAEALPGTGPARFLGATPDGSMAIFSSGEGLYEFDVEKALAGEAATSLITHKVKGIMGMSTDASRIYLVSNEDLDEGATADKPNLYLYERGAGFTFIATLSSTATISLGDEGPIRAEPFFRTSRVTPDGLHAAFTSSNSALAQSVAEYDNLDAASGRPDREVYLYDAGDGELVCASCNPSGARPSGRVVQKPNSNPDNDIWAAARIPGWTTSVHPANVLSEDGRHLFFECFEPLVPRDTNGAGDVYEWEPVEGSEKEAREECLEEIGGELFVPDSHGCLSLISSGQSSADAEFVDASADGHDVFIFTNANLVPQDTDFQDIYDAREGGGFPPPPPPSPPCEGDACQSPAAPSDEPTPASGATQQSGNLPPLPPKKPRCAKNKRRVMRNGKPRCVPKHKRHPRRAAR
jgi:hypothetical protein